MNEYDSERLAQSLLEDGWTRVQEAEAADLLLVNTCTVRKLAEEKAFSLIGRWAKIKKQRPDLVIGMVGCLAQHLQDQALKRAPAIDFMTGPRAITQVPKIAKQAGRGKPVSEFGVCEFGQGWYPTHDGSTVTAYVAAMEGCDQFCTYCAVPRARGREFSRPCQDILSEIRRRVASGTREITLLGQNITRYGYNQPDKTDLAELLRWAADIPDLLRLRFLTGHPKAFNQRLIRAMAEIPQVCESIHLPLQAGSDSILSAMKRGYTADDYSELVQQLQAAIPGLTISTDFIVGFPGETEEDFQATLDIAEKISFHMAYCFKFSSRKDTVAALLPNQVPREVKEDRLARLLQKLEHSALNIRTALVGKRDKVLIEKPDPRTKQCLQGRTRTNHIVNLEGPREWISKEIEVEITSAQNWSLSGKAI